MSVAAHELELARTAEALPAVVEGWVLVRRIGSGGMGDVFLARHEVSGTLGAVKRLTRRRPGAADTLAREARALMQLGHPHIVPVFDVGEDYLVTRYIEGGSLARRLHTPLEPAEALRIARVLADALEHAHTRGVVHRDVKPSNVLVDGRGTPYLTDFGLATFAGDDEPRRAAGTPQFMAPEQRRGGAVGPAADQYALGRTLLEMLVGASVPVDAAAALAELPAYLPSALRAAIARATDADPARRFASMADFAAALEAVDLGDLGAPRRRAEPERDATPFAWLAGAHATARVGPDLARADVRIGDLAAAGLLAADAVEVLLARAGIAELGFTVWGAPSRLGPITAADALAAASDVVILMHGFGHTRDVWSGIARAICRDNARAIVIAPDLPGFGESRWRGAPTRDQCGVTSLTRLVDEWRRLLGLAAIPTALVGHSMSGMALLNIPEGAAGVHVSRIALNPTLVAYDPSVRRRLRFQAFLSSTVGRIGPLRRAAIRHMGIRASRIERMTADAALAIAEATSQLAAGEIARMLRALAATPPSPPAHARLAIIACLDDPWMSHDGLERWIAATGLETTNVHRFPSGGHHPHLEILDHPEWSARNAADIVRIIDGMLLTAAQTDSTGSSPLGLDSTVPAGSTLQV